MPRKRVNCPTSWTLVDENIPNVERVSLEPDTQRILGCSVNEHVFLEFPWAFVPRDSVLRLANEPGSALEPLKERLHSYQGDSFLIGYSSNELSSDDFVVCMTEEARDLVVGRNRDIGRKILEDAKARVVKYARERTSFESNPEECCVRNTREYLELEISMCPDCLGLERGLTDRNSGDDRCYVEMASKHDRFENIFRSLVTRPTQTHYPPRDAQVQTYPGYPKNVWTQYSYEEAPEVSDDPEEELGEDSGPKANEERGQEGGAESRNEQEQTERTPLMVFLESRTEETIDVIKYNTVVNPHVDDIVKLSGEGLPVVPLIEESVYDEQASFISLRFTRGKIATDVAWDPKSPDHVAVAYIANGSGRTSASKNCSIDLKFEPRVLIWSLNDQLGPRILLEDHREIRSISFCPERGGVLVGGASTGQVLVWDINGYARNNNGEPVTRRKGLRNEQTSVPVARAIFVSDRQRSHCLPVRGINWMPSGYKIVETGQLTKLTVPGTPQFVTGSEDGTLAIWNVPSSRLSADSHQTDEPLDFFRPVYRLIVGPESQSSPLPILSFSLPSNQVLSERGLQAGSDLDSKEEQYLRRFWIGTREGLARCQWSGQSFQPDRNEETCSLSSTDGHVHDGPVTEVLRSPHLEDVLLTIGGHVFAVWRDDYLDSPVFRRRSSHRYTACCWTKLPGVVLIGREDGCLETWDLKKRSSGPVSVQTMSSQKIAGLYLMNCQDKSSGIGLADGKGAYRVLREKLARDEEDEERIERLDWFEEFVWREVRRKKVFLTWQADFLANDPVPVARRTFREQEERKRELEEARERLQREHEARLRLEAERKARLAPRSKDAVWRSKEYERMSKALLEKRKLDLTELEEKRRPAIVARQERLEKLAKAERELTKARLYFDNELATEFPEVFSLWRTDTTRKYLDSERTDDYVEAYFKVRDKAREALTDKQETVESVRTTRYRNQIPDDFL